MLERVKERLVSMRRAFLREQRVSVDFPAPLESHGVAPAAGLVEFNGTLYGTTSGGASGKGTIFAITP
jgi:hypothetical protein